jgi:hypothetical protein
MIGMGPRYRSGGLHPSPPLRYAPGWPIFSARPWNEDARLHGRSFEYPPPDFLALLRPHEIQVVVDVRSSPYTKYAKHFNREDLSASLKGQVCVMSSWGTWWEVAPRTPRVRRGSYVLYDRLSNSPAFQSGMKRLVKGAKEYRVALLCGEEDPSVCHRHLLIARVLGEWGLEVSHLRGDGSVVTDLELIEAAREAKSDQMGFFAAEATPRWRSLRPVARVEGRGLPRGTGIFQRRGMNRFMRRAIQEATRGLRRGKVVRLARSSSGGGGSSRSLTTRCSSPTIPPVTPR